MHGTAAAFKERRWRVLSLLGLLKSFFFLMNNNYFKKVEKWELKTLESKVR